MALQSLEIDMRIIKKEIDPIDFHKAPIQRYMFYSIGDFFPEIGIIITLRSILEDDLRAL